MARSVETQRLKAAALIAPALPGCVLQRTEDRAAWRYNTPLLVLHSYRTENLMKPLSRIVALTLIGSLFGLSGCVWPDGGYHDRSGGHEQRRGGDDNGRQGDRNRGCDDQRRDDCQDQHQQ